MSLSVTVHKDISEYREKVALRMSGRTLLCVAGGLATLVAAAALCRALLGVEAADASLPVMAASLPFWLMGFWRPHGMEAERWAGLWLTHMAAPAELPGSCSLAHEMPEDSLAQTTTRAHRRAALGPSSRK